MELYSQAETLELRTDPRHTLNFRGIWLKVMTGCLNSQRRHPSPRPAGIVVLIGEPSCPGVTHLKRHQWQDLRLKEGSFSEGSSLGGDTPVTGERWGGHVMWKEVNLWAGRRPATLLT